MHHLNPSSDSEIIHTKLRFFLTSTVGHEVILTDLDLEKMCKALLSQSKTLHGKIWPFFNHCREKYQNVITQEGKTTQD
jgi:hypothetical protein